MVLGLVLRGLAKCCGLKLRMIGELVPHQDFDLVVSEVRLGKVGPLFQHYNAKAVRGEFFGQDAACRAAANNDEIDFVGCLVPYGLGHRVPCGKHYIIIILGRQNCRVRRCWCTMREIFRIARISQMKSLLRH